jgi:PST family polysaccharide transporter
MTIIITAIRRVSLAAFSRMRERADGTDYGFEKTVAVVVALTLPLCVLLAGYSGPIVSFLYGVKWMPAADAVRFLAVLTLGRVAVELTYDYLAAGARTRETVWLHLIWLIALVPALIIGARQNGITGVAVAHAIVTCVVVFPLLAVLLKRDKIDLLAIARMSGPAVLGAAVIGATIGLVRYFIHDSLAQLFVGAFVGLGLYTVAVLPVRHTARALWNATGT